MPQPIPKTDSREVEIPDSQSVANPLSGPLSSARTEAWIRIWRKSGRGFEPVGVTAGVDTVLVQMISDLLMAGGAGIEPDPSHALIARFPTLASVVSAAKRVQRCVAAYTAGSGVNSAVGIAISAVPFREASQNSPNVSTLFELARPGRIVLGEEIWRELEAVPGSRLRRPGEGPLSGGAEARVRELVWTPARDLSSSSAPVRFDRTQSQHTADSHSVQGSSEPVGWVAALSPLQEEGSFADLEAPRGSRKHLWFGLTAAVLLLAAFSTLLLAPYRRHSQPQGTQRPVQNPTPPATATGNPSAPASANRNTAPPVSNEQQKSENAPTAAPSEESNSGNQASAPPVSREPEQKAGSAQTATPTEESNSENQASAPPRTAVGRSAAAARKAPGPQTVNKSPKACSDYFVNDVSNLLEQADRDAGSGKYAEATHAYQVVLCLEPGNARAKASLQKVMRAAELNEQ